MRANNLKQKVAEKVVNVAVKVSKNPEQICFFLLGKPEEKCDLSRDDYKMLESFLRK